MKWSLVGIGSAVILILWRMLLPGYILTLDMVWVPQMLPHWSTTEFNNAAPVWSLISLLASIIPSWVVQKIFLVGIFFFLFYVPYKFLPFISDYRARLFGAALYALNPFVYARFLAGQWLLLAGYALLPLVLASLIRLTERPSRRSAVRFALSLLALGFFSIHLLYLTFFVTVIWLGAYSIASLRAVALWRHAALSAVIVIAASSYWLAPALLRQAPLEARFDTAHYEAFAAAVNVQVPVMLNVLVLGGYWGEGAVWNYYFRWPQQLPLFWVAAAAIGALVIFGAYCALRRSEMRLPALLLICIGVLAYSTALGAGDTPVKAFNIFLYAHVPLWSGLRDSQKIAGMLALVYTLFAALGAEALFNRIMRCPYAHAAAPLLFVLPAIFGLYEWGGFHGQLQPVWYPSGWSEAKILIQQMPTDEKVLVLPWHGYFSLDLDHELIVSNPAEAYFDAKRIIAGKSIEVGSVHDEEIDPAYRALDALLSSSSPPTSDALAREFGRQHIGYLLIINDTHPLQERWWSDRYASATSTPPSDFDGISTTALLSGSVTLEQLHLDAI